ncbi:MAG TPA: caspase family protein, partial [Planctomycetota bacterium]|nr:caspase family protein [Planctomycetota bacterium]
MTRFRSRAIPCLLLGVASLVGCHAADRRGGEPAAPDTASPPVAREARADGLDVPLTLRPLAGAAIASCQDRGAVLVVADRYHARPADDLPQLALGVAALREQLVTSCAIPAANIVEKSGPAAIPQEIEGAIRRFGETATGAPALLVVFYAGHGAIDGDGQLQLFTHYTTRDGGGFRHTLARAQILRWLDAARVSAKARGVELQTVLIVDACRTATLSAPPRARLVRQETWELYSTGEGELAEAPRARATPFVEALCTSLAALAQRGEADLRAVFQECRRALAESGVDQRPQLVAPREDAGGPALVMPGRVRIGLRVVDALADTLVDVGDDGLRADGKPLPREGEFFVLQTSAGRNVQVTVQAPGYRPFDRSLPVHAHDNGSAFAVPIAPLVTRVRGRVSPPVTVAVAAELDDERAVPRDGYHRMLFHTAVNDPEFELLLPPAAEGSRARIVVKQYGRELAAVPVDLAASQPDPRLPGVRVLDVGSIDLPGADVSALPAGPDPDAVARLAAAAFAQDDLGGIRLPPQFAEPILVPPTFSDSAQRIIWDEALTAYQDGNLELARVHLQSLANSLRGTPDLTVGNLLGHVELRLATRAASDADVAARIAAVQQSDGLLAMSLRVVLAARKLRQANQLVEKGDRGGAVAALREAVMLEPDDDTPYASEARRRLRELRWSIAATLYRKLGEDEARLVAEELRADDPETWNDPDWHRIEQPLLIGPIVQLLREGLERGLANDDWSV